MTVEELLRMCAESPHPLTALSDALMGDMYAWAERPAALLERIAERLEAERGRG